MKKNEGKEKKHSTVVKNASGVQRQRFSTDVLLTMHHLEHVNELLQGLVITLSIKGDF